jgi:hypothetical protein
MAKDRPDFIMSSIVFTTKHYYQYDDDNNYQIWYGYNDDGDWVHNDKLSGKPVYVAMAKLHYNDLVEQGAATENLFSDENLGVIANPEKYAIIAGRFAQENPKIIQFLQKNPHKLVEFAEKLGVKLTTKNSFSGFISRLFGASESETTDLEAFKAQFKTEFEAEIKSQLTTTHQTELTALETKLKAEITELQKTLNDKNSLISELEKRPKTVHSNPSSPQQYNDMPDVKTIFGSAVNKRAIAQYNKAAKSKGLETIDEATCFAPYEDAAATYQDHVKSVRNELMMKALESFRTRDAVTSIPAVKGKVVVTEQHVGDIVKQWRPLDGTTAGTNITLKAHEIATTRLGFHEKITPAALEGTYLGELRKSGQDPRDFPFEAFLMMQIQKKIASFAEKAFWRAEDTGSGTDGIDQFDGILHQINDAITATDLTETTLGTIILRESKDDTPDSGEIGHVALLEDLVNSAPDALLDSDDGLSVFCRRKIGTNYQREHRNLYGTTPKAAFEPFNVDGQPATAYPLAGINNDRVIATPKWNIIYGYDAESDMEEFNVEWQLNQLHIFGAFRIAAKLLIIDDDTVIINEHGN